VPSPTTGIGPALREARESLGKSLEEASRDTKIKPDYLHALEGESFGALRGDVYVRGFLRSYASYLGLDPEKVVTAYAGARDGLRPLEGPEAADPAPITAHPPKQLRVLHRRANWGLALVLAAALLVALGGFGLLSRSGPAPGASALPSTPGATPPGVAGAAALADVYLQASKPIRLTVVTDGTTIFSRQLKPGHPMEFHGSTLVRVIAPSGGILHITVNGHDLGSPGTKGHPYSGSFTPADFRETSSPSPG
jgi:cytoskeleton protein RodZ